MTKVNGIFRLLAGTILAGPIGAMGAHAALPVVAPVITTTTKTTSPVVGKTTTTTVATTTPTLATVTKIVPLTAPVVKGVSPLVVLTSALGGKTTSTVNTTGGVVANSPSTVASLLGNDAVFKNPQLNMIDPKWGKIRTFWGKIRTFEGEEVSPFWGKIRTFWGDTGPFEGDMTAFWGTHQTYNDGSDPNAVEPEWGKIRTFWGELGGEWGKIRTFWDSVAGSNTASRDHAELAGKLNAIVDRSALFWGDAVEAKTGKNFRAGFANALLARYGIDLNDPRTLAALDVNEREHFFLEWYDGLMQFSGADNPDHWMRQVNWSPRITQIAGSGSDTVIGLLDFTVAQKESGNVRFYNGVSSFDNGHGAAVASLMVAGHDGQGVMGIAPNASVVAYNPFDATETAGWDDIRNGIRTLGSHGASIINMSLGVSGWTLHPDWNGVMNDPALALATSSSVFVIAAGNDGITQTQNIEWTNTANFIVVGSVDPAKEISEFSNRPGETCLLYNGKCKDGAKLMNRFIVAPGEMLLVSDGKGGVTRYSGTSFAAPLVSGTVALIHDRWPWLADHPAETVDIILKTATDLGAPGVDPVYGVGQLDVTNALSPINFNNLTWYQMDDQGRAKPMSSASVRSTSGSKMASWEKAGAYFYAFENIGGSYRDFAIPLSSKLVDAKALSAGLSKEQFQSYLYNQAVDWIKTGRGYTDRSSFNAAATVAPLGEMRGAQVTMAVAPRTFTARNLRDSGSPYQIGFSVTDRDGRWALKLGEGDGAVELGNGLGFGRAADYEAGRGGANPFLGMASGGAYGQLRYAVTPRLAISAGVSSQNTEYDLREQPLENRIALGALDGYRAAAQSFGVSYRPLNGVEVTGAFTRLRERDALLGVQAVDPALIGKGSVSSGMTMGVNVQPVPSLSIAASATMGRTKSADSRSLIATGERGFESSAFQVSVEKQRLFGRKDALRLSVAQPLHVDSGSIDITSVQVIDRQTGALGEVTERFVLPGGKRPLVGEFGYQHKLLDDRASLAVFGRAQLRGEPATQETAETLIGARFILRY